MRLFFDIGTVRRGVEFEFRVNSRWRKRERVERVTARAWADPPVWDEGVMMGAACEPEDNTPTTSSGNALPLP